MDKSETYIAMCAAATEVQQQWRQQYGDFYVDHNRRLRCWLGVRDGSVKVKGNYCVSAEGNVIHVSRTVWLPRLDQLIEMAQVPGRRYENTTQDFFDWTKRTYAQTGQTPGKQLDSLEKLWLAFVMQRNFGRLWKGSAWYRSGPVT
jgi:hypothetical protein